MNDEIPLERIAKLGGNTGISVYILQSRITELEDENERLKSELGTAKSQIFEDTPKNHILAEARRLQGACNELIKKNKELNEKIAELSPKVPDPHVWNCGDCGWEGSESEIARLVFPSGKDVMRLCPKCIDYGFSCQLRKRMLSEVEPKRTS